MKRKLPPLLAIRYFEAAGRNGSFTAAADEMGVTQAAISHQVRLLEEELKAPLFVRMHQRVELTPKGVAFLKVATESLNRLSDAWITLSDDQHAEKIRLTVTPLIAARWLMPQLGGFLGGAEGSQIVFHHSLEPPSDREPPFNIKIFFALERQSNPAYEFLFSDALVPVCSPNLLRGNERLPPEAIVAKLGLVHEISGEWWRGWFARHGMDTRLADRGMIVDDPGVLENAALRGHGIVLGSVLSLKDRLLAGDLIFPLGAQTRIPVGYYLLVREGSSSRQVARLRRWVLDMAMVRREEAKEIGSLLGVSLESALDDGR